MKKKGLITLIVVFILSLAMFFYLLQNFGIENVLQAFFRIKLWHIGVIIGIMLIHFIFFNIRWKRILKSQGYDVPFKDLLLYRFSGFAVSYLTPAADFGGEPVMAYLLSKNHPNINMPNSFASVVSNRMMDTIVNLLLILISFFYIISFFVLPDNLTFIFYITLAIAISLMIFLYNLLLKKKNPLHRLFKRMKLYKVKAIYKRKKSIKEFDDLLNNFFHDNLKELSIHTFLSFLTSMSLVLIIWVLARFLGFDLGAMESLVSRSIDAVSLSSIPVPGSLGFSEAGSSAWFEILSIGGASGFSFYLLYRTKDIFFALVGLGTLFTKGIWDEVLEILKEAFQKNNTKKDIL